MSRLFQILSAALIAGVTSLGKTPPSVAGEVTIFAAASLKNALDVIREDFESQTGYSVVLSFAGSSLLARQIELGAPADVYFPASTDWMDYLEEAGRLVPDTRRNLLTNSLALVAPRQTALPISGFDDPVLLEQLGQGRLAMALVTSVPAGIYGASALRSLGLWHALEDKIAQSDNVRAALALVAVGEAPLGIVYTSDAKAEPRVVVLAEFPASSHTRIQYPFAQIRPADNPAATAFLNYLQSAEARGAFRAAGFEVNAE